MEDYRFYFLNMAHASNGSRDAAFATDALALAHAKGLLGSAVCEGIEVWQAGRLLYHESKIPSPQAPPAPV